MAGEVVFSNLGGHAWQSRPAMPGGPVLADVMTPSSVPIMLVRPGYRPELNIDATLRGYLDTVRQEIARRPRPVLQAPAPAPARRAAVATGGTRKPSGTAKTGGATKPSGSTTPPPAVSIPSPRRIDPMEQTMRTPAVEKSLAEQELPRLTDLIDAELLGGDGISIPELSLAAEDTLSKGQFINDVTQDYVNRRAIGQAAQGLALTGAPYLATKLKDAMSLLDAYRRTSVIPKPALGSGRLLSAPKPTPTPTLGAPSGALPPGSGAIYQPYTPGGSSMPIRMSPASGQPLSVMQSGPVIQIPQLAQTSLGSNATNFTNLMSNIANRLGTTLGF